ncbi:MAG: aminotransferase class III-fold pyridoxal phosphate-dependent enzyme, partial [Burkholderiales bacterium]|nr:aminotransferase class III-fold pyridoxal phosphate-dependent enzyme [Burkholderiales bacterium]
SQYFGVTPDLLTFAKGVTSGTVPLGGVLASRAIHDTFMNAAQPGVELFHGYTYSGHPLAAAACIAALDTYADENLFERAEALAAYFEDGVHAMRGLPHVVDCRNLQLIGAVELAPRPGAPGARALEVFARAWDRGVYVRPIGESIAFCPPLIAEKRHLDEIFGVVAQAIREVP